MPTSATGSPGRRTPWRTVKPEAEDRLAAALELQGELKRIVAGEPPLRSLHPAGVLACQPIGWEPDINDGVRLNIRPFLVNDLNRGKKGCGLFRAKPGSSLKWDKDRGNEPRRPKEGLPVVLVVGQTDRGFQRRRRVRRQSVERLPLYERR